MDIPQYKLKPNITRMILPQIIKLVALAALFYLGLWFNLKFGFNMEIPAAINVLVAVVLLVLVVLQLVIYHIKYAKFEYLFYPNRIEFHGNKIQTFLFRDFQGIDIKRNVFDTIAGTGTILVQPKFRVGPVSNAKQVIDYMQKLIQYFQYAQRSAYSQPMQMPMTFQGQMNQSMPRQSVQRQSVQR